MARSADDRLLGVLDDVERVIVCAGRLLMLVIIAGVLGFSGFAFVRKPWGAGHQGEPFYFAVAVLLVLCWAVGQYVAFGRRQRRQRRSLLFDSRDRDGAKTWELRLASAPEESDERPAAKKDGLQFNLSTGFEIPLTSVARELLPDEEALQRLDAEIDSGATLEEACRSIQPAFDDWNWLQRRAYLLFVEQVREQWRASASKD